MSFVLTNKMLDIDCGNNSINRLLGFLARYASDDGSGVYPANETLMKKMGCSRRSIQSWMKILRASGIILEVYSHTKTREYRFNMRLVDMLCSGVVSFVEMVMGRVVVRAQSGAAPQLVLPGLENERAPARPSLEGDAQRIAPENAADCTQISNDKTTPRACALAFDLRDKCLAAAKGVVDPKRHNNLDDVSSIQGWLASGCDLELDILPIIAMRSNTKAARGGCVYTWDYYTKAVLTATARRTSVVLLDDYRGGKAGAVGGQVGERHLSPIEALEARKAQERAVYERNRRAMMQRYNRTGQWDDKFGEVPTIAELASVLAGLKNVA